MTTEAQKLTVELEAAALRAVRSTYADLNYTFFKGRLSRPPLALSDGMDRLGRWETKPRGLSLSRSLLMDHGWGVVVEVLKHEMAHQYVDEVLGIDEPAHGPAFRKVCDERGIDARAAGIPEKGSTATAHGAVLDRISKLLALAESANEHEARAAMGAAQRLMLKYNIEEIARGASGAYGYRHLGRATGRVSEPERVLADILSAHFFVDVIWVPVYRPLEGKRGTVLEVCGRIENLELADYVHAFLLHTSERLWRAHKRRVGIRHNRDRRAYLAGVMAGFQAQLDEQAMRQEEQGLVWVGDPNLGAFFKARHPRIRMSYHVSSRGTRAHSQGVAAGRKIVLHRGVSQGHSGTVRLLGRGK